MSVMVCDQFAVLGDGCPECGFWLHREQHGGYPDQHGVYFCSEDCIADQQARAVTRRLDGHLGMRDLLCDCAEYCAPCGLPDAAMRQEYADYLASIQGTP
jgi:hypothetical protein